MTDVYVKLSRGGEMVEKHQVDTSKRWAIDVDSHGIPVLRFFLFNGNEMGYSLKDYRWSLSFRPFSEKKPDRYRRRVR